MSLPLIGLFLAAFAVGTAEFIVAGLLPALAADLGVDIPTAGLLITGYAIGVAIGGPLLAIFTGSLPRRPLLLALMVAFVFGNMLCALATDYWLLLGARLVVACAHGLFFGTAMVVATRLVPRGRQSTAVSIVIAGITVANVLGAPAGAAIGYRFGWQMSFWAIAALGIVATGALAVLLPKTAPEGEPKQASLWSEVRVLGRPVVLLSYAMIALAMTAFFVPFSYIVPILTEVTGISTANVPWLLFISGVGGIFGNLIGGRLGDWKPMPALVVIFTLGLALYLAGLVAVHDPVAMTIVFFFWALVGFSFAAPVQTRILTAASDAPNLASTLISTAFNIGIAAGAWLGGMALTFGWDYAELPWISAGFLAITLVVALLSWSLERRGAAGSAVAAGQAGTGG
ncbi:MFS transporter [Bauldia litoralis]|uniref:MFS transporter n=3 Tax=Bauldia litoralis TaxID=665467 RepID=UPI003267BA69